MVAAAGVEVVDAVGVVPEDAEVPAAVSMRARRRTASSEKVRPLGLPYMGTQMMPFTEGSRTRRSTMSISGLPSTSGTGTHSTPSMASMWKCQS